MLLLHLKKVLKEAVARLSSIPQVEEIVLFGSVARGDFHPYSDVDLLVIVNGSVPRRLLWEIAADIYVEYGVPVTIIPVEKGRYHPLLDVVREEGRVLWRRAEHQGAHEGR